MLGSQVIAELLKREGVEQVFCFPMTPILEALTEAGVRLIVARQERVAGNMADGFSRTSFGDRIGVVTVQQGPGAENAFAGIAHAYTDSSPILFLPGHPGRNQAGVPPTFGSLENYRATTKWADRVPSAAAIPGRMARAFTALRSGRPGPVLLEIPVDVAEEEFPGRLDYRPVPAIRTGPDPAAVREAVRLMLAARRPLIWAGQGIFYARASRELEQVAEQLAAPVMTSLQGKSAFNETHPLSLGTTGYSQTDMVGEHLASSDVLLVIGSSLTRSLFAPAIPGDGRVIVHATLDWKDLNKDYRADLPLLGDAKLVLQQMLEEIARQSGTGKRDDRRRSVEAGIGKLRNAWQARWAGKLQSSQAPINPYRVIGELKKAVDPASAIVTHDSGSPRDQIAPLYEAVSPRGYLGWGNSTQLGFSLGAAMGAKLAAPDKLVVTFMGDAAFGMVGMDLETAVRGQIPILVLLLNNSAMGGYEQYIPKAAIEGRAKFLSGNYSQVARGLGAYAERVEDPEAVQAALQRGIAATREGRPALLEFITCEETDIAKR